MSSVRIPLHSRKYSGLFAIIDEQDFERVSAYQWNVNNTGKGLYARAYVPGSGSKGRRTISLHRFVLNAPSGVEVDHKDGNKMDCTRQNLRLASHAQNTQNCPLSTRNTSGFKGVTFNARNGKWRAKIQNWHLGCFDLPEDAARAYDVAARASFGAFARCNFPE